ncbi:Hypothetical_protein [Hexamita inflata]|uniref:Hypothetical_protein n=1 Tax=Hexamita inflata TaxID=28002 RepID=A0ABP1H200_9EUKA
MNKCFNNTLQVQYYIVAPILKNTAISIQILYFEHKCKIQFLNFGNFSWSGLMSLKTKMMNIGRIFFGLTSVAQEPWSLGICSQAEAGRVESEVFCPNRKVRKMVCDDLRMSIVSLQGAIVCVGSGTKSRYLLVFNRFSTFDHSNSRTSRISLPNGPCALARQLFSTSLLRGEQLRLPSPRTCQPRFECN